MNNSTTAIDTLLQVMVRLRAECPWDAKQTHESLKPYLIEEAYEVLEAIDDEAWDKLASELGDLLLQVVFHSQLGSENGHFDFDEVARLVTQKLIDRHPHIFGKESVKSADEVQQNWEHIKHTLEKRKSILSGIPKYMPALLQAQRLQQKAASVGFEWDHIEQVIAKIDEELEEFKEAVRKKDSNNQFEEFGDLLFSLVNLSRYLGINSEDSLRKTNNKFIRRFNYIEKQYGNNPAAMNDAPLEELDRFWNEAKAANPETQKDRLISQLLHDVQSLINLSKIENNRMSDELKKQIGWQEKVNKELLFFLRELELDKERVSIKKFIESSLRIIGIQYQKIIINIDKNISEFSADIVLLSNAFNALTANALQAVQYDLSKITISVLPVSAMDDNAEAARIRFIITDKGEGIPEDFIPLIYDPFFTTKKHEGFCGFGLSNAKKIIEAHGGEIHIKSQKGIGTEAAFDIPVD
jgi:MazG family protein